MRTALRRLVGLDNNLTHLLRSSGCHAACTASEADVHIRILKQTVDRVTFGASTALNMPTKVKYWTDSFVRSLKLDLCGDLYLIDLR